MKSSAATREWQKIARGRDRFYSIASVPGKKGGWTSDEFYEHGRGDWQEFRRHWDHFAPARGDTCLEIGCGAGRMTAALATDFKHVVAVDVSQDMLDAAAKVVPAGVDLRLTDGRELPVETASVNAIFSVHVIQHLETREDVAAYVSEMRRALRPGGTFLVHVMLKVARRGLGETIRSELELRRSRLALRWGREHLTMRVRRYWLGEVWELLTGAGFVDVELRTINAGDYAHECWFGRVG